MNKSFISYLRSIGKGLLLLLFLQCLTVDATAQLPDIEWFPKAIGDKKWKPLFGLDSRRSFLAKRSVRFFGLRLGAQHRGVHRFGLGFYGITGKEEYTDVVVDRVDASNQNTVRYDARYSALFYERTIMKAGKWEVVLPINWGGGSLDASYEDIFGNFKPYLSESFNVIAFGPIAKYKVFRWLEPGIGGGYRQVYNTNRDVQKTLSQPYYIIKVSILVGELYRGALEEILKF